MANKTVGDILAYCNAVCPNVFETRVELHWLNEIEGMVQTEVMRIAVDSDAFRQYELPDNATDTQKQTLLAKLVLVMPPHDKLYGEYVCARICEAEGEIARANNYMSRFNDFYDEFKRWFIRNYKPNMGGFL